MWMRNRRDPEDDVESNEEGEETSWNEESMPRWQRVCGVVAPKIGLDLCRATPLGGASFCPAVVKKKKNQDKTPVFWVFFFLDFNHNVLNKKLHKY